MLRTLAAFAGQEAGKVARDLARRVAFLVIALIFVIFALGFGGLALFLWLITFMSPPLAGLVVAGLALLIALIALLLARPKSRPREPHFPRPAPAATNAPAERLAADAGAVGVILSRYLKPFPLVATALGLGLVLGRIARKK